MSMDPKETNAAGEEGSNAAAGGRCAATLRSAGKSPRDKLIHLASDILLTTTPPSQYLPDHKFAPTRVPARWWRWLCGQLIASEDERKRWAIQIRAIADSLPNPKVTLDAHSASDRSEETP